MQNGIIGDDCGGTVTINAAIIACVRFMVSTLSLSICCRLNARGWGFFWVPSGGRDKNKA
jgi:hypothetical protein